jgi:hypothetical protein
MLRKALPEGATFTVLELAKCPKKPYFVNGKPKKVTMTNLKACSNYLFAELEHIKPSVIISTSTNITKVLGIKGKANYDNRGEFYLTNLPNLQVQVPTILTLHVEVLNMIRQNASGKMYGPDFYSVILNDFIKAGKILTGALRIQDLRERIERVRRFNTIVPINIEEVERWVDTLMAIPNEHVISWDLKRLLSTLGRQMQESLLANSGIEEKTERFRLLFSLCGTVRTTITTLMSPGR